MQRSTNEIVEKTNTPLQKKRKNQIYILSKNGCTHSCKFTYGNLKKYCWVTRIKLTALWNQKLIKAEIRIQL